MRPPLRIDGELPTLHEPVLIVMLTGWIDASAAAFGAMEAIKKGTDAQRIVTFDPDSFIDYRVRRPMMELRDGKNNKLVWSAPEMYAGKDDNDRDVLILCGPEPDSAWLYFADVVGDLCLKLGVVKMFGIGAYPFAAPHTRPPQLSCTSPSEVALAEVPFIKSSADVPAGMESVLEHAMQERGIQALGLWGQVPHYVSAMPYPAASAALVGAVQMVAGLSIDVADLRAEAVLQRERIDKLVSGNTEHLQMVQQLETAFDEAVSAGNIIADTQSSGSGDAIADEIESFLREQNDLGN
ncbi:MAG: hypothetical protein RLZZ551_577 [Actinomycetota bacterium]